MGFSKYILIAEAKKLEKALEEMALPKGWTESSVQKFAKSLTNKDATEKGFFDACVKKIGNNVKNPEAFCAAVKDKVFASKGAEEPTKWRGKGKSKKQMKKDTGLD